MMIIIDNFQNNDNDHHDHYHRSHHITKMISFHKRLKLLIIFVTLISSLKLINCQSLLLNNNMNNDKQQIKLLSSNSCTLKDCHFTTSIDRMTCEEIKKIKKCLDNLKESCHGSIHYHSHSSLIDRKSKEYCRNSNQNKNKNRKNPNNQRRRNNKSKNNKNQQQHHQQHQPPIRSMYPTESWNQQQLSKSVNQPQQQQQQQQRNISPIINNVPLSKSFNNNINIMRPNNNKPDYFNYCLQAAYNFTIGLNVTKKNFIDRTINYRKHNYNHEYHHSRYKRQNDLMYFNRLQQKLKQEQQQSEQNSFKMNMLNETTVQLVNELIYKPIHPMTPSLTCIIFGDPHLRTFDSRYQTCNCLGARSLIEHPLFDVQITNTKILDQFNSTGVTKVTVLVRRFDPCMITNELIYETDSLAQASPAGTFTDGSVYNFNNMIYINTSMKDMVVTIHLEHIGVRVYISQFVHTKFLNVVIKFLTSKSNLVRQDLVLNSINPVSLCKSGCHHRELINIENELKRANIGIENNDNNVQSSLSIEQKHNDLNSKSNFDNEYEDNINHYDTDNNDDEFFEDDDNDDYEEIIDDTDDDYDDEDMSDINRKRRRTRNAENDQQLRKKKSNRRKKNKTTTTSTTTESPKKLRKLQRKNRLRSALEKSNIDQFINKFPLDQSGNINFKIDDDSHQQQQQQSQQQDDNMLIQDCYEKNLIGYYRLACLYDTMIKGAASTLPFVFASSFDEPKFRTLNNNLIYTNHHTMNEHHSSSSIPTTISSILIIFNILIFYFNI